MTRGKKNERGATAVEYGLLAVAVLAIAIIAISLKTAVKAEFVAQSCNEDRGYHCNLS